MQIFLLLNLMVFSISCFASQVNNNHYKVISSPQDRSTSKIIIPVLNNCKVAVVALEDACGKMYVGVGNNMQTIEEYQKMITEIKDKSGFFYNRAHAFLLIPVAREYDERGRIVEVMEDEAIEFQKSFQDLIKKNFNDLPCSPLDILSYLRRSKVPTRSNSTRFSFVLHPELQVALTFDSETLRYRGNGFLRMKLFKN